MKRKLLILCLILLATSYFTINAYGSSTDSSIRMDNTAYQGYGSRPVITVKDNNLNVNPRVRDELTVKVYSSTDTAGIEVRLKETVSNSGEFTGDFGISKDKSDAVSKVLQVLNNDTITAEYKGSSQTLIYSAKWKAFTGTVNIIRDSYTGLSSIATVSITDKDSNLRSGYIDTARVRIYSDTDPKGIILSAYEIGSNTGIFNVSFGFDVNSSYTGDALIKVSATDKIYATYIDEMDSNGNINVGVTDTANFQFAEATIKTSATKDEGSGSVLTVTIDEPDANNPKIKDRIIAKASSGSGTQEMTIWLEESGINTGSFKCRVILNDEATVANSLRVQPTDTITIKYTDKTVPQGGTKEITKSVKWTYIGTLLKADSNVYSGYTNYARITLVDFDLNEDEEKADTVDVHVTTSDGKGITLELKETGSSTGEFTGSLYFGKSSKASAGTIKVVTNDSITITYTNKKDRDDVVECTIAWSYQNGVITLDRQEYRGNDTPVRITLRDLDASDKINTKDDIKVYVRLLGNSKDIPVTLSETSNSSGVYTGMFYINGKGDNRPSVNITQAGKFDVVYTDKLTTSGRDEERIATSTWGGISPATLTFDKPKYVSKDEYVVIKLIDPDLNKNSNSKDKATVIVKTVSGKTNMVYTLTETGADNGEFIAVLEMTEGSATTSKICLAPSDGITATYIEKSVTATATFAK